MNSNTSSRRSSLAIDGQQSLLHAIKSFVHAVDSMDETVMIPCRLRDIPAQSVTSSSEVEVNNNKAIIPTNQLNGDLYNFYVMLHAIRKEITAGPKPNLNDEESNQDSDDSLTENDPCSDSARKTAAAFRYHLRGLFGLLHQMTETANVLSSRYEKEVSSAQNGISSVSSFSL